MTVAELIVELQALPPTAVVVRYNDEENDLEIGVVTHCPGHSYFTLEQEPTTDVSSFGDCVQLC